MAGIFPIVQNMNTAINTLTDRMNTFEKKINNQTGSSTTVNQESNIEKLNANLNTLTSKMSQLESLVNSLKDDLKKEMSKEMTKEIAANETSLYVKLDNQINKTIKEKHDRLMANVCDILDNKLSLLKNDISNQLKKSDLDCL